jgi:hypothetical protein
VQLAQQFDARVNELTEELISSAAVISSIEARLAAAEATSLAALQDCCDAEVRSTAAEHTIEAEVQRRLQAVGADRSRWPPEALKAVQAAEAKACIAVVQASDAVSGRRETERQLKECQGQLRRWQERVECADVEVSAARAEARLSMLALERQLKTLEVELRKERQRERRSSGHEATLKNGRCHNGLLGSIERGVSTGNGVSLVGKGGVDVGYLRGLLFSLLAAVAAGKAQERDALLPVVGMLVGASPIECKELQQKLAAGPSLLDFNLWTQR